MTGAGVPSGATRKEKERKMSKKFLRNGAAVGALLAALWGLAGANLSAQGIFGLSEQDEIELGKQASAEVEKKEPVLDDRAVTDYVDRLGQALASKSQRPGIAYHFKVIDSADINAFALPGGYIYVNRGLLEAAGNESELVGVLGHEISHVAARHSVDQIKKLQIASLGIGILGAVLGDGKAGAIGNIASQMVATGVFLKYSREAEREADRLGARNVFDAGWDPRGMVTFFDKLAALRQRKASGVETFFSSHPDPAERAANVDDVISSFGSLRRLLLDSRDFHSMQLRLKDLPPPVKAADDATQPGQPGQPAPPAPDAEPAPVQAGYRGQERDREIASRFAPVFRIGITSDPRFDYPARFDFDGDWRPDNNAQNANSANFRPAAYAYYSVAETPTHYLIHYGLYFPVDDRAAFDRRARSTENDWQVCLVAVEKATEGSAQDASADRVALVETHFDGEWKRYLPNFGLLGAFGAVPLEDGRPRLFVDPNGHRVSPDSGSADAAAPGVRDLIVYRYAGRADEPGGYYSRRELGYDLLPMQPLWDLAKQGDPRVFAATEELGTAVVETAGYRGRAESRSIPLGRVGVAFRAGRGGQGARLPWAWAAQGRPAGEWFLDPVGSLKARLNLNQEFSSVYLHQPTLAIFR